jgi:hypothetical protein
MQSINIASQKRPTIKVDTPYGRGIWVRPFTYGTALTERQISRQSMFSDTEL